MGCEVVILQAVIVLYSGSIALLADTIHNIGDAATAIPLWIAFKNIRVIQVHTIGLLL